MGNHLSIVPADSEGTQPKIVRERPELFEFLAPGGGFYELVPYPRVPVNRTKKRIGRMLDCYLIPTHLYDLAKKPTSQQETIRGQLKRHRAHEGFPPTCELLIGVDRPWGWEGEWRIAIYRISTDSDAVMPAEMMKGAA